MGLQAGLPLMDFSGIRKEKIKQYFAAVRAGLDRDYEPMRKIFEEIIKRTLSRR